MLLSQLIRGIKPRPPDDVAPRPLPPTDGLYSKIVNRYRPSSVLRLLLFGFALVAMPLGAGLVTAFFTVDLLSEQSKRVVLDSVRSVQAGQRLQSSIAGMERNARQFQILVDQSFYQLALEQRDTFNQGIQTLRGLGLPPSQQLTLTRLESLQEQVFNTLKSHPTDSEQVNEVLERFGAMSELARELWREMTVLIAANTEQMRASASRLQRMLAWLASGLILAAVGLSIWITLLLARPIQQLEGVIRRLGKGRYSEPVHITGPRDLEHVGARLDWLRKQLLEAERQKSRFLRHVSHELKTPLTAIREGCELLRDQVPGPLTAGQAEVAQIMRDNSLHLQRLIEDLLSFSLQGRPAQAITRKPVCLERLVNRVVNDQKLALAAKSVQVRCQITAVTFPGDEEKLRLILDNLLSNAVKHSPRNGLIDLRVNRVQDDVAIDILDDGPGIAEDEREKVFEAFYQGSAPSMAHVNGTGLGLAITREYVSAHGGTIGVLSSARGAHLQVRLPLQQTATT